MSGIPETPKEFALHLEDNVACATQLRPDLGELPNASDWRRNAEKLYREQSRAIVEAACAAACAAVCKDFDSIGLCPDQAGPGDRLCSNCAAIREALRPLLEESK